MQLLVAHVSLRLLDRSRAHGLKVVAPCPAQFTCPTSVSLAVSNPRTATLQALHQARDSCGGVESQEQMKVRPHDTEFQDVRAFLPGNRR